MNPEEDDERYAEDADMAGVSVDMDSRTRITVRKFEYVIFFKKKYELLRETYFDQNERKTN